MSKPRLLDLFSGAGGCAMGYHRAGFDVVGVDQAPMPHYPFEFHQADAIEFLFEHGHEFDAVHASPPCQKHTRVKNSNRVQKDYPCFIDRTRELLTVLGKPWIMENVVGAPLINPIQLCGSAFGLRVRRHRLFESNFVLWGVGCKHEEQPDMISVVGTGGRRKNRRKDDRGGGCNYPRNLADARDAMGIDWMTRKELSQAIPPAYTEFLGKQLMAHIKRKESA